MIKNYIKLNKSVFISEAETGKKGKVAVKVLTESLSALFMPIEMSSLAGSPTEDILLPLLVGSVIIFSH